MASTIIKFLMGKWPMGHPLEYEEDTQRHFKGESSSTDIVWPWQLI